MTEPIDPTFPWSQKIINHASNYGNQGIFVTQVPPPPPPMPLDQAQALLAELPLDDIPAPQTLPEPHRMPFAHNPLFVGREDSLRQIAVQLKAGGTIAVTTGIGGVGKTQLAIEAAHRYGRYFGGGVFWLSFADPGAIATEVADCGRRISAFHEAEKLDLDTQVQRTLARWATALPRLLVFDNCEDEALLRLWRPKTGACRVLVTSRKQTAWSADLRVEVLPLEVLAREESIRLLQQLAPRLSSEEAGQIAEELGDLPLALHLAGCYLAFYDDMTPQTYLAKLRAINPLTHWSLQGDGVEGMPTDRDPHVARAFALSFDRLNPEVPTDALAQALLARAACFAPGEPFAREWLAATVEVSGDEEEQIRARIGAIKRLLGLGLLEIVGVDNLRVHRLLVAYVAQVLRNDTALIAVEVFVANVAIQLNDTRSPNLMQSILPHLQYLIQQASSERRDVTIADLKQQMGACLRRLGNYQVSEELLSQARTIREQTLGIDHKDVTITLNTLAELYRNQGRFSEALPLAIQALEIRERILNPNHYLIASSLHTLAGIYRERGDYQEALPFAQRALAIREQIHGPDHSSTAQSLNSLAYLYLRLEDYQQALKFAERALTIRGQVFPLKPHDVAESLNTVGEIWRKQGKNQMALPFLERALSIRRNIFGEDNPDTARVLMNIASLLRDEGEYDKALSECLRVLEIRERIFGEKHHLTGSVYNNIGLVYLKMKKYHEARNYCEMALSIREQSLDKMHPDIAVSLYTLSWAYQGLGRFQEAILFLERAIVICEQKNVPEIPKPNELRRELSQIRNQLPIFSYTAKEDEMSDTKDIIVKTPSMCTPVELETFESLVLESGEVSRRELTSRIKDAKVLLFLYADDDTLIGIAALKNPNSTYRRRVFEKAKTQEKPDDFTFEVGWVYIIPDFRGKHLSRKLIEKALEFVGSANVYATTREDNEPMRRTNIRYGFNQSGELYPSDKGDYNLILYTRLKGN